jgi:hypothetical protein
MGPAIIIALTAHHTPTLTSRYSIPCKPPTYSSQWQLKVMKPRSTVKKTECGVHFTVVHSMKIPVHTIQSRFTTCVVEFVNLSCLMRIQTLKVCSISGWWRTHYRVLCTASRAQEFLTGLQISKHFNQFFFNLTQVLGVLPVSSKKSSSPELFT